MHPTLYTLTPREQDILSNLDQSDVIAAGPWRKGECSLPHRAVVRDLGNKFVIHDQVIGDGEGGTAHYANGTYIHETAEKNRLLVAWRAFEIRVRRHHSFPLHD